MKFAFPLLFLALVLLTSSKCKDKKKPLNPENVTTTTTNLLDTEWYIVSMTLAGKEIPVSKANIIISEKSITGNGGCNNFKGSYQADGKNITVSRLGATRKYCGNDSKFETKFLKALEATRTYNLQDDQLVLITANGKLIFSNTPVLSGTIKDLRGDWLLTRIQEGDMLLPIPSGVTASFTEKDIKGNGGCNNYSGSYTAEKNSVSIRDIQATEMHCEATSEFEHKYILALLTAETFTIKDNILALKNSQYGDMTFRRKTPRTKK